MVSVSCCFNPPQMQRHEDRLLLALPAVHAPLPSYLLSLSYTPDAVLAAFHCLQEWTSHCSSFESYIFFLVATVDREEDGVPSFFIFYYPPSLSFFYTKTFQYLGDIKIHINKIDHE